MGAFDLLGVANLGWQDLVRRPTIYFLILNMSAVGLMVLEMNIFFRLNIL